MSTVRVGAEQESTAGWRFEVHVRAAEGPGSESTRHEVILSWVDYEHWSHGAHAPARVVDAVMRFLLDRVGYGDIAARFDAARVRRTFPEVDDVLPTML